MTTETKKAIRDWSIVAALLAVIAFGIYSFVTREKLPVNIVRVDGVDRVLMHESNHYTFFVSRPDNTVGILDLRTFSGRVTVVEDMPADQPVRVEYTCRCKEVPPNFVRWRAEPTEIYIRLHSVKEINGAGWNHGKFGSGQTTVVE